MTPPTEAQVSTLQTQAATSFAGAVAGTAAGTVHLNTNFDGTQNNFTEQA